MVHSSGAAGRIREALVDLVQPTGYVTWEYLSRQWLLAGGLLARARGPDTRILDVGCGYGALSLSLSEGRGFDVVAMDILPTRIAAVRGRKATRNPTAAGRMRLLIADAQRLPFHADTFDAVVATEVLEHLNEPERLFREVHRVLRRGGRFLMTTPNAGALPYRFLRFLPESVVRKLAASCTQTKLHPELLHDHGEGTGDQDPDRHRREGFTLQELKAAAADVGLRTVASYTYRFPIPDRVMSVTPHVLSRSIASLGTRPLPLGLQLFAEFERS